MKLYEIDEAIMSLVDDETGEITNPELFNQLQMEEERKIEGIACWIKNMKSDAEAIKTEKQALAKRQQTLENKITSVSDFLQNYLNGRKIETSKVVISYRASESVEVDMDKVPKKYLKVEYKADKEGIKKLLKEGKKIKGCSLVSKSNMQVK